MRQTADEQQVNGRVSSPAARHRAGRPEDDGDRSDEVKLKVSQRPGEFFELFAESARNLRLGTEQLRDLVVDYTNVELKARRLQEREHEGDKVTHTIIRRLNT